MRNGKPLWCGNSYDGGTLADTVGTLRKFIPMDRTHLNRVDAAIYQPTTPELLSSDIYNTYPFTGVADPKVGQMMTKSGRTTGYTSAPIIDTDATVTVSYDEFEANFEHQIVTEYMSAGGDSGSAGGIGDKWGGLLFAGSDVVTIFNRPDLVISELGLPNIGTALPGGVTNLIPPLIAAGLATYLYTKI